MKFSQIWILSRSRRISLAMSRSSSMVYPSTTLQSTLTAVSYNSTRCDMFNSLMLAIQKHVFTFLNKPKKVREPQVIFVHLSITTESEERLAVTSLHTISMRYISCKVNSFSQEFPKIFLYRNSYKNAIIF